jgi:hypothetical protein
VIITSYEYLFDAVQGNAGTHIVPAAGRVHSEKEVAAHV